MLSKKTREAHYLEKAATSPSPPRSYRQWAGKRLPAVTEQLDKVSRAKLLPAAAEYVVAWPQKKRALEVQIENMADDTDHLAFVICLGLVHAYVNVLEGATPEQFKYAPSRSRRPALLKSIRRDLDRLAAQGKHELTYLLSCGDEPVVSDAWGRNAQSTVLMMRGAHDPSSIVVSDCSEPVMTMRDCWRYTCTVRGRNVFGATVMQRQNFREDATMISIR